MTGKTLIYKYGDCPHGLICRIGGNYVILRNDGRRASGSSLHIVLKICFYAKIALT